ncbi:DUF2750 domain-containing protein [Providencia manganoxydans]|uniref:DUF2750 domain-containing protein n=1 Tax=Providencia manganoxydans TaxID=2923283 RepID=UPI00280FFC28|nr:DUF2750 domain-containing protein [Providencia stuartii]ELR5082225.1 DUF2750 domain-containing protein [Providencia stuartii]
MFSPNQKQIKNVLELSLQQKYLYFVGKVVDWQEVWTLCDVNELVTFKDDHHRLLFPVWPAKAYVERNLEGKWLHFTAKKLDLTYLMTEMLPDMHEANITIAIMMDPQCQTYVITEANPLLQDLIEECKQYQ